MTTPSHKVALVNGVIVSLKSVTVSYVQSRDKSFGMYKQTQTKSVVKVKLFYTTTLKYYSSTL